ncbi:hypothetical protein H0H81_005519 [Sphagnurus paluster]|uniref:Uncharacterized protein n=1 Tax=Sphagnurus paluster TaxID=117069 RepID=A0A9P7GSD0_9AGAR|nr:hypothetical protein H0H81_005519 [Sphagnurus paluster]
MAEKDIQHTARFSREFLVMSLLPWMEKCMVEWNETFSSTRRLPSRLFSSTRRLFGSPSPSPTPVHNVSSSVSSLPTRSATLNLAQGGTLVSPPSQQRRLAEFATIIGDLKLAVTVWESLRKESKGGSDILPLLLAPSPTLPLYASNALSGMQLIIPDPHPQEQLTALRYAVRWEAGISTSDFISHPLEGERWLVWAAGNKTLSPSFWESEGKSPFEAHSIDTILSGIEHPLGRLLYTTGDVAAAVRFFLGLLRGSPGHHSHSLSLRPLVDSEGMKIPGNDKIFLDDFRVAFAHFKATSPDSRQLVDLKLPFTYCIQRQAKLRLPDTSHSGALNVWKAREEQWNTFTKSQGIKQGLASSGKASVDETFWIDLVLHNPLDTEVNLSNLTLIVQEANALESFTSAAFIQVETIDDVVLNGRETRTVPIGIKSMQTASLVVTHATYNFLSLLPSIESLASRGPRLHHTPAQRQSATYAPDVNIKVEVEEVEHKLVVNFDDDEHLVLAQGERKKLNLWFSNTGTRPIKEIWIVSGPDDEIWVGPAEESGEAGAPGMLEVIKSQNSVAPMKPKRIILSDSMILNPGEGAQLPLQFHPEADESAQFRSVKLGRYYEVHKLFETSVSARPSQSSENLFLVQLELSTLSRTSEIHLTQVTSISPTWKCTPVAEYQNGPLLPFQTSQLLFGLSLWGAGSGSQETFAFVSKKLQDVLNGTTVETSNPPSIDLLCSHISEAPQSLLLPSTPDLISLRRRTVMSHSLVESHPHIPSQSHPHIFPLYNPAAVDFLVFWEIPSQRRSGYITLSGLVLGASHAALGDILEVVGGAKVKRSMYAETQREKAEMLNAISKSEWNAEMNPLVLLLQEPDTVYHDFMQGPCLIPVTMKIRNYSLTHKSRFYLRLNANLIPHPPPLNLVPAPYTGRLAFRGTIDASKTTTIEPELWITRPGTYGLVGWSLETEVLETSLDEIEKVLHRYKQVWSQEDKSSIVVCNAQPSSS